MLVLPRSSARSASILLRLGLAAVLLAPVHVARAASVQATHGAVASEHRLASAAGVEILQRGGNAVDAAVATALATGVVNPSSSGLGGGGFLVLWDAAKSRATSIDFRETAPRWAYDAMYIRADGTLEAKASRDGALAIAVPGEARGLAMALERYGRLSFADVAAPAIRIAREGFAIEAHLAAQIASGRERLAADPELARVFLHADLAPKRKGELLKRPELAATLERLATVGVEDFYRGQIAADIAKSVAAAAKRSTPPSPAQPLDQEDLAAYRPLERAPLLFRYRGRSIAAMAPPSSGGGVLTEILAVLGPYNVAKLRGQGAAWPHLLGDTMKAVFADRAAYYGDPAFTTVPLSRLLSPAHADQIRAKLNPKKAVPSASFGPNAAPASDAGTSNISVVDADGNAVALTTSVNTSFGSGVSVAGRDVILNNTMDDFSAQPGKPNNFGLVGSKANAIAPGKRPLSSMTPVVVTRDGQVELVLGGSGGPRIITATLQTMLGVIDLNLSVDAAVSAPRIHHQWMPEVLMVEDEISAQVRAELSRLGHRVVPLPGGVSVTAVGVSGTGPTRKLEASSDPRKGGVPAGY